MLLESDDSSPKDFYINQFEVIDDYLPENWETKNGEDFIVWKAPKAWLEEGFWQRFDNAEEESLRVYLEERNKMM